MPRFYFDVHDGVTATPDSEGLEFESMEAAQKDAERALIEIAKDAHARGKSQGAFEMTVRDETGKPVLGVTLRLRSEQAY
jgi:hypothetical protein